MGVVLGEKLLLLRWPTLATNGDAWPFERAGCADEREHLHKQKANERERTQGKAGTDNAGSGGGMGQLELICAQHGFLSKPGCILFDRHSQMGRQG